MKNCLWWHLLVVIFSSGTASAALLAETTEIPTKVVEGKGSHEPKELGNLILDTAEVPEWIKLTFIDRYAQGHYLDEDEDEDEEYLLAEDEQEGRRHHQHHITHHRPETPAHQHADKHQSHHHPTAHHHSSHSHRSHGGSIDYEEMPDDGDSAPRSVHHLHESHAKGYTNDVFLQSSAMEYGDKATASTDSHHGVTSEGLVEPQRGKMSDEQLEAALEGVSGDKHQQERRRHHHKHYKRHWGGGDHGGVDNMLSMLETYSSLQRTNSDNPHELIGIDTHTITDILHNPPPNSHHHHHQHHHHLQYQQYQQAAPSTPGVGDWYSKHFDQLTNNHNQQMARGSVPYNVDIDYISKHAIQNAMRKTTPEQADEADAEEIVMLDETQRVPAKKVQWPHQQHHHGHHPHHQHHSYQHRTDAQSGLLNFVDEGSYQYPAHAHNGQHSHSHSFSHIHKHAFPVEHWENDFVDNILSQLGFGKL